MRLSLAASSAAIAFGVACTPPIEEGKFSCTTSAECPADWFCREDRRCWSTPASSMDSGAPDASEAGIADAGDAGADASCVEPPVAVDLLVMVDNSNSMAEEQVALADALPELVRALATGDVDADRVPDFTPVSSLHVGVVSSDMGTGGHAVPTCSNPAIGDDGKLLNQPSPLVAGCEATYPTFLEFEMGEGISRFRMDFSCIGRLGTNGCGMEQQLEAVLKAVTPSTSELRFVSNSVGHGDTFNAGFLREGSVLVTLLVTDEDDCSALDTELYNPSSATYTGELSRRCTDHPEALHGIARYADGLQALRPGAPERLVFAAIVGIPADLDGASLSAILADPRMEPTPIDATTIANSCESPSGGGAYPPKRIVETARELSVLGSGVSVRSICQASFTSAIDELLARIQTALESSRACP